MEKSNNRNNFNQKIRERTMQMAVAIHDLFEGVRVSSLSRPIINQLIRCSSSVAANYRAATRSRSDGEFFSKICIVVEECDETQYWLDYITRTNLLKDVNTSQIRAEVDELVKLFTAIKSKMKTKLENKNV
ncbi:MAG: four helix bundle protein [Bacteroidetes bacterium]|nr:four helix bundle protein [Bacteroidota bacterium]